MMVTILRACLASLIIEPQWQGRGLREVLEGPLEKNGWGITPEGKPRNNRAHGTVDHEPDRDSGFDGLFNAFQGMSIYITGSSGGGEREWRQELWRFVPRDRKTKEKDMENDLEEVCVAAVTQNKDALEYVPEVLKARVEKAGAHC
jgi:hypothetical protein